MNQREFPLINHLNSRLVRDKTDFTIKLWQKLCICYTIFEIFAPLQDVSKRKRFPSMDLCIKYFDEVMRMFARQLISFYSESIPLGLTVDELCSKVDRLDHPNSLGASQQDETNISYEEKDFYEYQFNQIKSQLSTTYFTLWEKVTSEHQDASIDILLFEFRRRLHNRVRRQKQTRDLNQVWFPVEWLCFVTFGLTPENQKLIRSTQAILKNLIDPKLQELESSNYFLEDDKSSELPVATSGEEKKKRGRPRKSDTNMENQVRFSETPEIADSEEISTNLPNPSPFPLTIGMISSTHDGVFTNPSYTQNPGVGQPISNSVHIGPPPISSMNSVRIQDFPQINFPNNCLPKLLTKKTFKFWQRLCVSYTMIEYFRFKQASYTYVDKADYLQKSYRYYAKKLTQQYAQDIPVGLTPDQLCQVHYEMHKLVSISASSGTRQFGTLTYLNGHQIYRMWTDITPKINHLCNRAWNEILPLYSKENIMNPDNRNTILSIFRKRLWELQYVAQPAFVDGEDDDNAPPPPPTKVPTSLSYSIELL